MTNRELAKKIFNSNFDPMGSIAIDLESLYASIERALDEAEKRGKECHECNEISFEEGYVKGQREMRERAAMFLKDNGDSMAADAIRALTIDGEEKE